MSRFCSIFNQLLQLFPRAEFQKAVIDTRAERHARGFSCWDQFVAMLFAQLGRAHSLREICGGLASCEGKLAHLGAVAPRRSTLAYANAHRPWPLYQAVFYQVLARCREVAGAKPFRFKNKLLSLDATVIDLCAEMFPVGGVSPHQRRGEAAFHARSRRLPADLPGDHRRQAPRGAAGARAAVSPGDHRGRRQGVHRLRLVRGADGRRGVLRDAAEAQCRLHGRRAPRAAAAPRRRVRSDAFGSAGR